MKLWKLGTDVYFTNALNHWPQRRCDKRASIETPQEQLVIVTSQWPAVSSCIDEVTIGQYFEIIGSTDAQNSDGIKCWFTSLKARESHKWSVHRIHGARNVWYCSVSIGHIVFRGDIFHSYSSDSKHNSPNLKQSVCYSHHITISHTASMMDMQ